MKNLDGGSGSHMGHTAFNRTGMPVLAGYPEAGRAGFSRPDVISNGASAKARLDRTLF